MAGGSDLLNRVHELSLSATGTTKSIASFLSAEGAGLAGLSMNKVARSTYTSKASLVRFAQLLGFEGWTDFRDAFIRASRDEAARSPTPDISYPFEQQDDPLEAIHKVFVIQHLAYQNALDHLSDNLLHDAAQSIVTASTLSIFAKLPNRAYGEAFAYNMRLMGAHCIVPHTEEAEFVARNLRAGDCALFLSYTGRLIGEPLCYVEQLANQGVTILSITSMTGELAQRSDIALTFDAKERFYDKIGGFYSCAALQCLLDALYVTCYLTHYEENKSGRSTYASALKARFS